MALKDVMASKTIGFDAENTQQIGVSKVSGHSTIMSVMRIQNEHENWNGWIATRGLVRRVALGIGSVPGYIWQHLGFTTARISDDTDVSWERN